ncbi:hypothetical protein WG219_11820 [Ectopseudomonas mendocina]|uniref:Uncharacterized protein n=1 Tax=Ectopseudomonas mendocina TaxID=300 RepID=A0ABZ2RC75_ECTME
MVNYSAIASLIAASVFSGNINYQPSTQPTNAQPQQVADLKSGAQSQQKDGNKTA